MLDGLAWGVDVFAPRSAGGWSDTASGRSESERMTQTQVKWLRLFYLGDMGY